MTFIAESLDSFLNENLGNLQPFSDMPEEWRNRLLKSGYMGGKNSEVIELPSAIDYKDLLKYLKDDNFLAALIKVDGKTEYMVEPLSTNKFKLKQAREESSVRKKRREEEERRRKAEEEARKNNVSEARRGRQWHDPAELGELSVPSIQKWVYGIKAKSDNVQFFVIMQDLERKSKVKQRSNQRGANQDTLETSPWDPTGKITNSQANRYNIYAEKKRAQLDKEFDRVLEKMKQQIIDNFDNSMEKVIEDMRRGYSWNVDKNKIGEAILKGIDMGEFNKFVQAYDAIEPNHRGDPTEASKKIKRLGF